MLNIGDDAPDFTLPDDAGNPVTLSRLLETGPVVVYFYPADFTPVCTREACMFRDVHPRLVAAGIQVVGISPQAPERHEKFREHLNLPFRLLADRKKTVIGAWGAKMFLGISVRRISYFVDTDRKIGAIARAALRVDRHRDFVERLLARTQAATP